jgi:long-chain-alcohol oxidase
MDSNKLLSSSGNGAGTPKTTPSSSRPVADSGNVSKIEKSAISGRNQQIGLSPREEDSLIALVETFLPPLPKMPDVLASRLKAASNEQRRGIQQFWSCTLAKDPSFRRALSDSINLNKSESVRVREYLSMLSSRAGTSSLCGRPMQRSFVDASIEQRTKILFSLLTSSWPNDRRQVFTTLRRFIIGTAFSHQGEGAANPLCRALGYPAHIRPLPLPPVEYQRKGTELVAQPSQSHEGVGSRLHESPTIRRARIAVGSPEQRRSTTYECDVAIVGTGPAAAVAACVLSQAGLRVLMIDDDEEVGGVHEPVRTGISTNDSGGVLILSENASTRLGFSGGWEGLPIHVRHEWATARGLHDYAVGGAFDKSQHFVWQMLIGASNGVSSSTELDDPVLSTASSGLLISPVNFKLRIGCTEMRYDWHLARRSAPDPAHRHLPEAEVFLLEAARHGLRIVDNCRQVRLISKDIDRSRMAVPEERRVKPGSVSHSSPAFRKTVVGVQCLVGRTIVTIKAREGVVVAKGAIQTPCLLQNSQLSERHVGQHLHLHPTTAICGLMYPSEHYDSLASSTSPVTIRSKATALGPCLDGYGSTLEAPSGDAVMLLLETPWIDAAQFKDRISCFRDTAAFLAIQRDAGEGTVEVRSHGNEASQSVKYRLHARDMQSLLSGVQNGMLALAAAGAERVLPCHIGSSADGVHVNVSPRRRAAISSNFKIGSFIQEMKRCGIHEHHSVLFSPHQMGTCRMSAVPSEGVVDSSGESWNCENLFIMDTSVFPTALGVNPLVTVLAMAHMFSQRWVMRLKLRDHKLSSHSDIEYATELATQRLVARLRPRSFFSFEWISEFHRTIDHWHPATNVIIRVVLYFVILIPLYLAWGGKPLW